MKKFALYSAALPPLISGQSIILDRLLNNLDESFFILMSTKKHKLNLLQDGIKANRYYYLSDYYQLLLIKLIPVQCIIEVFLKLFIEINAFLMKRTLKREKN